MLLLLLQWRLLGDEGGSCPLESISQQNHHSTIFGICFFVYLVNLPFGICFFVIFKKFLTLIFQSFGVLFPMALLSTESKVESIWRLGQIYCQRIQILSKMPQLCLVLREPSVKKLPIKMRKGKKGESVVKQCTCMELDCVWP